MNRSRVLFAAVLAASFAAVEFSSAAIILATQDTMLRSGGTNGPLNFNDQSLNLASSSHVIFQFNLSTVASHQEITSAKIEIYDPGTSNTAVNSEIYFVYPDAGATNAQLEYKNTGQPGSPIALDGPAGIREAAITYNIYNAATGPALTEFWTEDGPITSMDLDGAGLPAAVRTAGYYAGGYADSATLVKLNNLKDDLGYLTVFVWRLSGSRLFADREDGFAPRLVLETIPEPSTYAILGLGCVGLLTMYRRRSAA